MPAGLLKSALFLVVWLLVLDAGLNQLGQYAQSKGGGLLQLARYLEYGRSTEGKLTRTLGPQGDQPDAVVAAGWLDPERLKELRRQADPGQALVAVYGQSFAVQMVTEAARMSGAHQIRSIGAPAAPLSYAYAAYMGDKDRPAAGVVVIGVLASSLARSSSMTGLSLSFEGAAPYTFPVYRLAGGVLIETPPPFTTEAAFRHAFTKRDARWQELVRHLKASDPVVSDFTFDENLLDRSSLLRLARRSWVASQVNQLKPDAHSQELPESLLSELPVAKAQLLALQAESVRRGERLVVALLQDQGYAGVLSSTLTPFLKAQGIAVLDSAEHVDSTDARNFLRDGHFTPEANGRLARALLVHMKSRH